MVSSAALLICAQRLGKKLCPNCKKRVEVPEKALLDLGFHERDLEDPDIQMEFFEPVGFPRCSGGYKGRFALLETMRMSDEVKRMVVDRANIADVKQKALDEGMLTLRRCALLNAARGKTSLQEVEARTMAD